MFDACLKLLELDYFELGEAFKGLKDENVWKRPAPGLLSVGELAGHIAYWESIRLAGEGEDLSKCKIVSPLIDPAFRYFSGTISSQPQQRNMTAEQVHSELLRVHQESVAHFKSLSVEPTTPVPGLDGWTYGAQLEYLVFHIAYHTGQIYTARHLLGEQTPDN